MTWEKLDLDTFPLTYGETGDGTIWVSLASLVEFMRDTAARMDEQATKLGMQDADEVLIAGQCGAAQIASQFADSFTLFAMDCDLSRAPLPIKRRGRNRGHE